MEKLLDSLSNKITELFFRLKFLTHLLKKMEENYSILHPGKSGRAVARETMQKAVKSALLLFLVGGILLGLYSIKTMQEGSLKEGHYLSRDKRKYTVNLDAQIGKTKIKDFEVEVATRIYTDQEIEEMIPDYHRTLEKTMLDKNETPDGIIHPLNLVETVEEYPFTITWKSSDRNVIDREGKIGEEVSQNGILIEMTATSTYEEFEEIYMIPIMVYPEDLSEEELLKRRITRLIKGNEEKTKSEKRLVLPEEIDGIKIAWKEEKTNGAIMLFVLLVVASIAIIFVKSKESDGELAKRGKEMMEDYPEIISKLTLLIGAGMTVRGAFKRITDSYQRSGEEKEKRYAYEEMILCVHEMENGIGEQEAYRHFSVRCREQKYVKLAALLEQSSRLGANGMVSQMLSESKDAFEERKNNAEKKGEEAGTKLLLPMFLMLGITMVVIIVPAFMSF